MANSSSQPERDRIIDKMAEAIFDEMQAYVDGKKWPEIARAAADRALRVVESPPEPSETPSRICTCGQNGYAENHWHSNHPHTKDCPQYTGYGE